MPHRLLHRLRPVAGLVLCLALGLLPGGAGAEIRITDILGRKVTLAAPAHRIVLGEARHLSVLGILHDDPVALVAGWRQDKALDPVTLAAYRGKFPAVDDIRSVGAGNRALSVEAVLSLAPDLVVLSALDAGAPQLDLAIEQIESAGIPVLYVDFFASPLENTLPSLRMMAEATGAPERAREFAAFHDAHLTPIRQRLAGLAPEAWPKVFMHVHAGPAECCATVGAGVFDDFITAAGGHNLGRDLVPGVMGNVGLENLIAADPDFYLASGGAHLAARGGLVLGPGVDLPVARAGLAALAEAPGQSGLRAVEAGHALGFWHLFNDSPVHVALIEYLAQQFHPGLFSDLDPLATMAEFEARFSPVPVPGTWWVDLE